MVRLPLFLFHFFCLFRSQRFGNCSDRELERIAQICIQVKIPAGREIYGQLNFIYVVVKGEVSFELYY